MTEYTPTTEEVRHRYGRDTADNVGMFEVKAHAEFDRWLAERDRQVAERAWDEGRASALIRDEDNPNVITVSFGHKLNPYRKEVTGD